MSMIWGTTGTKINNDESECYLEHSIVEPNFLVPASIMHESKIDGHRSWSKNNNYVAFEVMDYLYMYANPEVKAKEILAFEDTDVTFTFYSDGAMIQKMHVESVDFFPLVKPYSDDIVIIRLVNVDYLQNSTRIKTKDGKYIKTKSGQYLRSKGIII